MDYNFLLSLVSQNKSIREISKETGKSYTTVKYWLKKYDLKTNFKSFSNGYQNSNLSTHCKHCSVLLTENNVYHSINKKTNKIKKSFICKSCVNKNTAKRWKSSKLKVVEYKGGKCCKCGYNKCIDALEFHHVDPNEKDKSFSNIKLKKWETIKQELDKCILVCANCHREIHMDLRNKC